MKCLVRLAGALLCGLRLVYSLHVKVVNFLTALAVILLIMLTVGLSKEGGRLSNRNKAFGTIMVYIKSS